MKTEIWNDHMNQAVEALASGDFILAASEYLLASNMGCIDARIALAFLYATEANLDGNGVAAEKILETVINNKDSSSGQIALACNNLATLYSTGADGLTPDMNLAKKYKFKAQLFGFPE
jgi:hypothetical protein